VKLAEGISYLGPFVEGILNLFPFVLAFFLICYKFLANRTFYGYVCVRNTIMRSHF
jgi:hypothetical protein